MANPRVRHRTRSSYKSASYLISLYVRECSRDSFLLFEMLFCVTLGRSCSCGVYMAMAWDIIPFVSPYLVLMCYFSIIIQICLIFFILENGVENTPKTPESD